MRLEPPPIEIGELDGFTEENDLFGFASFGEMLAEIVQDLEQSSVLVLDGPWGSGKSTFAKQWAGLLRNRNVPVIFFDAFANDYIDDSFVLLASKILSYAEDEKAPEAIRKGFLRKAGQVGQVLLPTFAKLGIKAFTMGAVDSEAVEGIIEASVSSAGDDLASIVETRISERLEATKAEEETIEGFRSSLTELIANLRGNLGDIDAKRENFLIIVDELDRCRPTFALSMLERAKHLFAVEGLTFVLVTNLPHLEATVRGQYGSDIDARTYLQKFINLRIALPRVRQSGGHRLRYLIYLWDQMNMATGDSRYDEELRLGFLILVESRQVELREIDRIAALIGLGQRVLDMRDFRLIPLLIGLCYLKVRHPSEYETAKLGELNWDVGRKLLALSREARLIDQDIANFFTDIWHYVLDSGYRPQDDSYKDLLGGIGKDDRRRIIPLLIQQIDSLEIPAG